MFKLDNPVPPVLAGGFLTVWTGEYVIIKESEFLGVWRNLHKTWMKERHCLAMGCCRQTLSDWVRKVSGVSYPRNYLRLVLEVGVALEWAIPNTGRRGYSCFMLRPIRYEDKL